MPRSSAYSEHNLRRSPPRGAQVFFRNNEESHALAEIIQKNLNSHLIENSRRLAAPISRDIYLMKTLNAQPCLSNAASIQS
jgi:hypothetical protein